MNNLLCALRPLAGAGLALLMAACATGPQRPGALPVMQVADLANARRCVDNLLHTATVDVARLNPRRSYQMPVLRFTVGELVGGNLGLGFLLLVLLRTAIATLRAKVAVMPPMKSLRGTATTTIQSRPALSRICA